MPRCSVVQCSAPDHTRHPNGHREHYSSLFGGVGPNSWVDHCWSQKLKICKKQVLSVVENTWNGMGQLSFQQVEWVQIEFEHFRSDRAETSNGLLAQCQRRRTGQQPRLLLLKYHTIPHFIIPWYTKPRCSVVHHTIPDHTRHPNGHRNTIVAFSGELDSTPG